MNLIRYWRMLKRRTKELRTQNEQNHIVHSKKELRPSQVREPLLFIVEVFKCPKETFIEI